ncbi:MAG: integrase catalytic domain-containing protein, partial [Muribaculaceae bacterium]|nr:integrase catalytic domain-containing protein [Muribaculaceae bacterium]
MATIYLRLSKKSNALERQEVILTFRHGRAIYQRAGTGIFIVDKPAFWDGDKMVFRARMMTDEARYHRLQKERLERLCGYVNDCWQDADKSNVSPTWLKDTIDNFNHPIASSDDVGPIEARTNMTSIFVNYICQLELSTSRIKHLWSLWRVFRRFELWRGTTFEFETFSHTDLEDFDDFLTNEYQFWERDEKTDKMKCNNRRYKKAFDKVNVECYELGQKIENRCPEKRSKNTLNNILVRLKTFWIWCMKQGYTERNPFNRFKIEGAKYGTPFYINIEERHKLENTPMEGMVAVQRDIFVFQCCIGCRVSDLYSMTYDNIVDDVIVYTPQKTEKENPRTASVPLVSTTKVLIEKYYDPERGTLFPFISQQKYNVYIKKAFKLAGLSRKVPVLNPQTRKNELRPLYEVATSHMARRAFVGQAYPHVKDPNIIASMTGHVEGSKA